MYESSSFYRVPSSSKLLRVGVCGDDKAFRELVKGCCTGIASSFVSSGNTATVAVPPSSHVMRRALISWSSNHVEHHLEGGAVPIPLWSLMSGEACELDVFKVDWQNGAQMDLTRCNALVVLHSTERTEEAARDLEQMLASAAPEVPVVICGCMPLQKVQLGELGLSSVYHSFSSIHQHLAERNPSVYALEFACPSIWGQGFSVLYKSQMAALYKKAHLSTPEFRYAIENIFTQCDQSGRDIWNREAVDTFWRRLYGRSISEAEFVEFMLSIREVSSGGSGGSTPGMTEMTGTTASILTRAELLLWLQRMADTGKADFVWMALRAFGFDGGLHRTGGQLLKQTR
jgi:hypothetical protein